MRYKDMYEWMLINGSALAEAIKADGKMLGPLSTPLLTACQQQESPKGIRRKAKELLQMHLNRLGVGHLLAGRGE